MPMTVIDEPEPTKVEEVTAAASAILAGPGVIRTVALYIAAMALIVSPFPVGAAIPLLLLLASDLRMSS